MSNTLHPEQKAEKISNNHCLNCGTELSGVYCHNCGQQSCNTTATVGGFIFEYLSNAFMWDSRFIKTLWLLIRRPGYLTNEFLQGKIVSYVHPLKLNMFMLFVFISLFLLFASSKKLTNSVENYTTDEKVFPVLQLGLLSENPKYAEKILHGPRDTVRLMTPLSLAANFPDIVTIIEIIEDTQGEALDKWTAVIPSVLVEEKLVVKDNSGYFKFNHGPQNAKELDIFNNVWSEMVNITTRYYPIIVLLTAPFLSFSLRLVQRKKKHPHINNFIFALHYTAFIELFTLVIYISYLIFAPSSEILQWVLSIGSIIYLTVAFYNVYKINSWMKAFVNALFTSISYFIICLIAFVGLVVIACILVAFKL